MQSLTRFLLLALVFAIGAVNVSAQDAADLTASLKVQQQQITALRALLVSRTAMPDPRFYVTLDPITQSYDGVIPLLSGWGFGCTDSTVGTVIVAVDGVGVTSNTYLERFDRQDVIDWAAFGGACTTTPLGTGVFGSVDLSKYPPGDHQIQFWISNAEGLMKVSNIRTFTVPQVWARTPRG